MPTRDILPKPDLITPEARRRVWFQIAVVCAVGVLPDLYSALHGLIYFVQNDGVAGYSPATDTAFGLFFRSVSVLTTVAYFIWDSREPSAAFGLVRFSWWRDIGLGVLLFMLVMFSQQLSTIIDDAVLGVMNALGAGPFEEFSRQTTQDVFTHSAPASGLDWVITTVALAANSFAEEGVIWAFISTRLRALGFNTAVCILAPAAIFASYHLYQGVVAMIMIALGGMLHGLFFHASGRLWPLIISHTLINLYATLFYAVSVHG